MGTWPNNSMSCHTVIELTIGQVGLTLWSLTLYPLNSLLDGLMTAFGLRQIIMCTSLKSRRFVPRMDPRAGCVRFMFESIVGRRGQLAVLKSSRLLAGKSTVYEWVVHGVHVVHGRCQRYGSRPPRQSFRSICLLILALSILIIIIIMSKFVQGDFGTFETLCATI